ncbi:hypothetical protein [Dyadobacter sp. Leaf189]|uniref:hypothetical protein n=1 Tax=Dyadobacter sp. Leaf189 TaxID=1736295 RepID=UPI0006F8E4C6|nr:hypothetical protein [Dyadobacter sp. Leaf189]KQS34016.1 hypothetical protein ASG33_08275 [Dyadobacter sp. Leaf189]
MELIKWFYGYIKSFMKTSTKVQSFEEACVALGLNPAEELPYSVATTNRQRGINAVAKLAIIAEALNEGWKPDWSNWNERKYYPYFDKAAGGSGFSFDDFYCDASYTGVGSRLVFRTAELARYAGTQFLEIYREWMVFGE